MEKMDLIGVYHYFNTAESTPATFSGTYGNEIDAMLKYKVCKNVSTLTGIAYYMKGDNDATNLTRDETVFWLRGNFTF